MTDETTPNRILFVTGQLAASALQDILNRMNPEFAYDIAALRISVAAFLSTDWVARHLRVDDHYDLIMLPGLCEGDVGLVESATGVKTTRGPKDLHALPEAFGQKRNLTGYGAYRTKIFAEIVDAPLWPIDRLLEQAEYYRDGGADIIDLGWPARGDFPQIVEVLQELKARGHVVSLDTFHRADVLRANQVGFDYLLSVNGTNLDLAREVNCQKVVVVPDFGQGLDTLERSIEQLDRWGVPYIIDPIINPVNYGLADSIVRYQQTRQRHPEAEIMMGIGNVTELIDADSTGVNALLMGIVGELDIDYVLTTEVISWAKGCVREVDAARKLMHFARQNHMLPKHLDDRLLTIKDPPFEDYAEEQLWAMHAAVRDRHFRIFTSDGLIYVFNHDIFIKGTDPRAIFEQMGLDRDASHAFYMGQELQKAALALQLGKQYIQDEPLRWGYLDGEKQERHG